MFSKKASRPDRGVRGCWWSRRVLAELCWRDASRLGAARAAPVPVQTDAHRRYHTGDKGAVAGGMEACGGTASGGDRAGKPRLCQRSGRAACSHALHGTFRPHCRFGVPGPLRGGWSVLAARGRGCAGRQRRTASLPWARWPSPAALLPVQEERCSLRCRRGCWCGRVFPSANNG